MDIFWNVLGCDDVTHLHLDFIGYHQVMITAGLVFLALLFVAANSGPDDPHNA